MRIYIAGPSRDVARVRLAQALLHERGHTLTLDWLTPIIENLAAGIRDRDLSRSEQIAHAATDSRAIRESDGVLLLVGADGLSTGSAVELGIALGMGKAIVACGDSAARRRCIFVSLAHGEADTDAAGLALLEHVAGGA